jgi:hypothetical protein
MLMNITLNDVVINGIINRSDGNWRSCPSLMNLSEGAVRDS